VYIYESVRATREAQKEKKAHLSPTPFGKTT
jgi:hypothetical protein